MSKTNWQDPGSTEIRSTHISGAYDAIGKIEDAIGIQTVAETGVALSEVYISDTDRYRIYQAPVGKRNWIASPAPVIKKNSVIISTGFTIDYGGAIIVSPAALSTDVFTADVTYTTNTMKAEHSTPLTVTQSAIALPATAEGQLDLTVQGNTDTNLVINGNFANGTTGWTGVTTTLSAANNILSATGNGSANWCGFTQNTSVPCATDKRVFVRALVRVTNASCVAIAGKINGTTSGGPVGSTVITSPVQNQWYALSFIATITAGLVGNVQLWIEHNYADAVTANGKVMEVKEVLVIDMGDSSANELYNLTAAQMDARFPSWFDGTKSTLGERLTSVGKNLFDGTPHDTSYNLTSSTNSNGTVQILSSVNGGYAGYKIKVLKNTSYYLSIASISGGTVSIYDSSIITPLRGGVGTFNSADNDYVYIIFYGTTAGIAAIFTNVQLEKGLVGTAYEPHTYTEAYTPADIVLRDLPNGVKDEFIVNTGKLALNIQPKVLQAADIVSLQTGATNIDYVAISKAATFPLAATWTDALEGKITVQGFSEIGNPAADATTSIGKFATSPTFLYIFFAKGTYGTKQVETATVVGTITTAGNATVIVTAAGVTGSPITFNVAVALSDTAAQVAGKIITALQGDANLTALYTVGGTGATVTLTRKNVAADDTTLNINIANGTCAGLTAAPTSANTTAGVDGLAPAQAALAGLTINYQLLTPVTSIIKGMGQLIAEPNGTVIVDFAVKFEAKPVNGVITIPTGWQNILSIESVRKITTNADGTRAYVSVTPSSNTTTTITLPAGYDDSKLYEVVYAYSSELSTLLTLTYSYPTNIKGQVEGNGKQITQLARDVSELSSFTVDTISILSGASGTVEKANKSVVDTHTADLTAHGLGTGVTNTPAIALGANTIKHTGKVPVYPEIDTTGMHYVNLLGKDGDCEDVSKWTNTGTVVNSTTQKVFGSNSIKHTASAAQSYSLKDNISTEVGKYYLVSAWFFIESYTSGNVVITTYDSGTWTASQTVTANTSIIGQWQRIGLKISRGAIRLLVGQNVTATSISYVDGIMVNEISAADYALTEAQLLANYPYAESYAALTNPSFKNRRYNLVRNGNTEEGIGWYIGETAGDGILSIVNAKFQITAPTGLKWFNQVINVKANTNYYLSANLVNAQIIVNDSINAVIVRSGVGTFNSGTNTKIYVRFAASAIAATGTVDAIMLVEGTIAPTAYLSCDPQQFVIEGQFTSDDKLTLKDGALSGQLWWKHKTLFGKDYDWQAGTDAAGYKFINITNAAFPGSAYTYMSSKLIKYDGKVIEERNNTWGGADNYGFNPAMSGSALVVSVVDTDTSWAETVIPNNDEVKAFMNGWKATYNNGTRYFVFRSVVDSSFPEACRYSTLVSGSGSDLTVADGTKFVVNDYIRIDGQNNYQVIAINGNILTLNSPPGVVGVGTYIIVIDNPANTTTTSIATWCKNNIAPNYEGYRLHYKLANPEPITDANVHVNGNIWSIVPGDNYVNVDSGIVLGEVANPKYDGTAYYNFGYDGMNSNGLFYCPFKFKSERIEVIYQDQVFCSKVDSYTQSSSFDNNWARITQANFYSNATYTVDYQILKTLHAQSFSSLTMKYAQDVFTAISTIAGALEDKQQHDSALDTLVDLSMYEEGYISFWARGCVRPSSRSYVVFTIPYLPKKAIPIVTLSNIAVNPRDNSGVAYVLNASQYQIATITPKLSGVTISIEIIDSTGTTYSLNNGAAVAFNWKADCRGRI